MWIMSSRAVMCEWVLPWGADSAVCRMQMVEGEVGEVPDLLAETAEVLPRDGRVQERELEEARLKYAR